MALTVNRDVDHYIDQELRAYPVAAAKRIFKGALVGVSSTGHAQPLLAGDAFTGVAYEEADNSAGAAGAMTVRVYTIGDFGFALTGAAQASLGRPVFASADDTLTFSGHGNTYVGVVKDVPSANAVVLRLDTDRTPVKTITHAIEDVAAGVDIAARAAHLFANDAWIVSAAVVNQGTAAAGVNDANTCVVAVATGAGAVATATFNSTTAFPSANAAFDMGAVGNARALAGHVLTVAVTNGTTANPGPFLVEVNYV